MSKIKVYSQPTCIPCDLVKAALDRESIPYESFDISVDQKAREEVAELGYTGTPVVYIDPDNHWQGLRPDRLKALINEKKEVAA